MDVAADPPGPAMYLRSVAVALLLSALLLLPISALLPLPGAGDGGQGDTGVAERTLRGHQLQVIAGNAAPDGFTMVVNSLGNAGRAVLSRRIALEAEDYPLTRYSITGQHPGLHVYLFWRRADQGTSLFRLPLMEDGDGGAMWMNLARSEHWRGRITEIGVEVYGDLRGGTLRIDSLALKPISFTGRLATIISEWIRFDVWGQRSINYYPGAPADAIIMPNIVALAWALLALALLPFFLPSGKRFDPRACIAVVFIPWLVGDGLWQEHLGDQLRDTRYLYADKTQHERRLAAMDADLYRYALELREIMPASAGTRLFIVHDSEGQQYERLRMQYHLLPRNIYNFGRTPPAGGMLHAGDYVLALENPPRLQFDASRGILQWPPGESVHAERIHLHKLGTLYRVLPPPPDDTSAGLTR